MEFQKGDPVRYIPGLRGWHSATVVGYDAARGQYVIELSNGEEICAYEDELEAE